MNQDQNQEKGVYFGWWVVVGAFLIMAAAVGGFYSYGVFFLPIQNAFGWGRGIISGVVLVAGLTYAAAVPFTGWFADRYGYRLLTAIVAGMLGLGFILASKVQNIWQLYLFVGLLSGLGAPIAVALPLSMVSQWFEKRQGLALGIASAGIGVGTAIVPLVAANLLSAYGWRTAYALVGFLIWIVCLPAAIFCIRTPDPEYIKAHEGKGEAEEQINDPVNTKRDSSLSEALASKSFWYLFIVYAILIFCLGLAMTHIIPYAQDTGLPAVTAASLLSVIGLFSVIGRIVSGMISDRVGGKIVLLICIIVQGMAMLWVVKAETPWMFYLFSAVFGLSYGGNIVLVPKLTAHLFGLTSMGAIFGALSVGDGIGYGIGPILAGYLFDLSGSYDSSFLIVAVALGVALIPTIALREKTK